MDKISRGAVPKHMKMIADTLKVEPDTIMIPFSAESKQGREEIWELIDSLVLPDGDEEEIIEEVVEVAAVEETEPVKQRKPRWKAEGKETAKKTKKLQEKKAAKSAAKTGKKSKKK